MKTFQFTNRHGKQVQVGQEQAVLLYGNQSLKFDGELVGTVEKVKVKNPDGTYKKGEPIKNKDGSNRKNNKGEYIIEDGVYESKKSFVLDPESTPNSESFDYNRKDNVVELKSVIKGTRESPRSFLNKNSVK